MARVWDTIVIGAGAAGLAAARELQRAGRDVLVLEAGARVGGRIFTTYPAGRDLPVELGAEFLHGEAKTTRALLDGYGLRHVEGEGENLVARAGEVTRDERQFARVGRLLGRIDRKGRDESFADWLAHSPSARLFATAREQARRFVEGFHAADATRISAHALAAEGGDVQAVRRSGRVLAGHQVLAQLIAAELNVELRAAVQRVEWRRGRCTVHAARRRFEARSVIITVPIGVLQAGELAVLPMPRAASFALDHLTSGDVVRIPFIFRDRFWDSEKLAGPHAGFIHTPASAFNVWWTQYPVMAPMLVAWSGGTAARALLQLGAEQRADLALRGLAGALGMRARDVARRVVHWQMHDWSNDPLARGAYSYPLVGGANAAKRLAQVHEGTLAFAGEAAAEENGTVDGALASGIRAARRLQRALR